MTNARNLQMISWRKRNISLLIFLSIVLLACYPGCSSYLSVDMVTIVDEIPYLHATLETDEHCYSREDHYFMSNNNGRNWKEIVVPPIAMQPTANPPEEVQLTVCVPNQTHTCYRISGKEKVEISTDGGLTWKTDWKLPPGRKSYMARDDTIPRKDGVDTIPKDMGIAVRKAGHLVIVAMGNQGVLIKSTDGDWIRYPVATQHKLYERYDQAYPPPFFASSIREAIETTLIEILLSGLITELFLVVISITSWVMIGKMNNGISGKKIGLFGLPFIFFIILFFDPLLNVSTRLLPDASSLHMSYEKGFFFLFPLIGLIISWSLIILSSPNRKSTLLFALFILGCVILFWAVTYLPFFAWAFGVIPFYEIAVATAIAGGIFISVWGFRKIKAMALLTVQDAPGIKPDTVPEV